MAGVRLASRATTAAPDETLFDATPMAPGLPAEHRVSFRPSDMADLVGTPLRRLTVEYEPDGEFDGDVSGVDEDTIFSAGIWTPSPEENTISTRVQGLDDRLLVTNTTDRSVTFRFDSEPTLQESQYLNMAYYGVTNPSEGTYQVRFSFNDGAVTVTPLLDVAARSGVLASGATVDGGTVTVPSAYLPDGGFLVIATQGPNPKALGHSEYLDAGGHTDVPLKLRGDVAPTDFVPIVVFRDSNDDESFDPETDRPYLRGESFPVSSIASLRLGGDYPGSTAALPTLARYRGGSASGLGGGGSQYRGFLTNDPATDPLRLLSNPQFLTVGGFVLSVVGMLYQLVAGE